MPNLTPSPAKPTATPAHDPWMFLTIPRVEHHTGVDRKTILRLISTGKFPPADIVINQRLRFWKRETVANWNPNEGEAH
jgi:predicted DNA-binding transcriptional regulator AlpA